MTIGIDLRAIGQGKYSGVEEYTLNLLGALFSIDRGNKYILFSSGQKTSGRYFEFSAKAKEKNRNVALRHCAFPNRILNVSFKFFSWPKIENLIGEPDIVFEPNINLLPSSKAKKIVTFHDLSFERYGDFFSAKQIFWHNFVNPKKLAEEADFIVAVSESTKYDLMEIYGIPANKIRVVYSGILKKNQKPIPSTRDKNQNDNLKIKNIKDKYNLPDNYILYLGTIEPRKNIIGLIKAFELFKKDYPPLSARYSLVIAGSKGWLYEDIFRMAKNSIYKDDIIFTDFVSDGDKNYLYKLSSLFVYPSFYEGFGFPPLEAMQNGAPVITSDCSSLPEVVGGAALMVNPRDISQMARVMGEVLENKKLAETMIEKGYRQAEKFSWEKCARETLKVFESVSIGS